MKKLLFLSSLMLLIFTGCRSNTGTTIYGTECKVLSDNQINDLIRFSRKSLYKNAAKYKITAEELDIVRKTYPELRTEYRGDCYGTMLISWETPTRKLGIRLENHLDAEVPSCALAITTTDGKRAGTIQPNKTIRGR